MAQLLWKRVRLFLRNYLGSHRMTPKWQLWALLPENLPMDSQSSCTANSPELEMAQMSFSAGGVHPGHRLRSAMKAHELLIYTVPWQSSKELRSVTG